MKKNEVYLFVEKNNSECERAVALLESSGIPFVKIDIDENSVRGWMLLEFGSNKTPVLATKDAILVGLEEIEKYLRAHFKHK